MAAAMANSYKAILAIVTPLEATDSISHFIFSKMEKYHLRNKNCGLTEQLFH